MMYFYFLKRKKCILIARQNKIQIFKSTETCFTQLSLFFFSVSVSQRKIFMSFLFFIYFRERFNISWCKSLQNSYTGTSHTSHHIICSNTSTTRISDTSNLFIKYMLKTKTGFQLNSLQCVYSMLKRSLLLIAK